MGCSMLGRRMSRINGIQTHLIRQFPCPSLSIHLSRPRFLNTSSSPPGSSNEILTTPVTDEPTVTTIASTLGHHIGDFKQIGLASNYTPVGWVQQTLELIHVSTGLPWWTSIVLVTLGLRLSLFPLMVKLQRTSATMFNLRPITDKVTEKMTKAKQNNDKMALYQCSVEMKNIYKEHNVNPLQAIVMPLIQAPIMISFFMGIRKIAEHGHLVPSFQTGGLLWFTDLSLADPTYALPVLASLTFLATIQVNAETGVSTPESERFKKIFQVATVAFIPITASMPTGIFVYWITSSAWTLMQAILLKQPEFRKRVNLPLLIKLTPKPADSPKPLGFMEAFKMAYSAGREAGISLNGDDRGQQNSPFNRAAPLK